MIGIADRACRGFNRRDLVLANDNRAGANCRSFPAWSFLVPSVVPISRVGTRRASRQRLLLGGVLIACERGGAAFVRISRDQGLQRARASSVLVGIGLARATPPTAESASATANESVSFEDIFGLLVGAGSVPAYGLCSLTLVDIKRFQVRSSASGRNPVPKLAPCRKTAASPRAHSRSTPTSLGRAKGRASRLRDWSSAF